MRTFTCSLGLFAVLANQASAFWGTGHLLVSRQAQAILESEAPNTLSDALAELVALKTNYPSITDDEGDHPFTECATFADDIKGQGYSFQSDWHYKDQPYLDEGGSIDDYEFEDPEIHVVGAIDDLTAFLKGELAVPDSFYMQQIAAKFSDAADQRSFALRLVIHYLGDIHQPLHCAAEVDSHYPHGDQGGNYESVSPVVDGVSNLHKIWDSVIYDYPGYPSLPLNSSDWDFYTSQCETLSAEYPVDPSEVLAGQTDTWATQSYELATQYVYPGFTTGEMPSDEYKTQALEVLRARVMLGGRRLAELIKDIYPDVADRLFLQ